MAAQSHGAIVLWASDLSQTQQPHRIALEDAGLDYGNQIGDVHVGLLLVVLG